MPAEIYDSATVIKDVCISLVDNDKRVLLETVRCLCPPFGYLEWVNAPQDGGSVHLTCAITYTDQVIKPRNTCIKAEIADFSKPQTVHNRVVMLKIRPIPTTTSLSRISSALFNNSIQPSSSSNLQGIWRRRRSSFGQDNSPVEKPQFVGKTWSNVASGNHELHHSFSLNLGSTDDFPRLSASSTSSNNIHHSQSSNFHNSPSNNYLKTNHFAKVRRIRKNSEVSLSILQ